MSANLLSASISGKPILVAATTTPGTPIHTPALGATDLITLWVTNNHTGAVGFTMQWGDSNTQITQTIPAKSGWYLICDDIPLKDELTVTAIGTVANVVLVTGTVTRTP